MKSSILFIYVYQFINNVIYINALKYILFLPGCKSSVAFFDFNTAICVPTEIDTSGKINNKHSN